MPKGIKGTRQKVIVTHNPREIDQAQELLVRFPNLGSDDVIIPGMANLSFNIELTFTIDTSRTLVSNKDFNLTKLNKDSSLTKISTHFVNGSLITS